MFTDIIASLKSEKKYKKKKQKKNQKHKKILPFARLLDSFTELRRGSRYGCCCMCIHKATSSACFLIVLWPQA